MQTLTLAPDFDLNDRLTVFQSALYQTNATCLDCSATMVLLDPCWLPHEVEEIKKFTEAKRKETLAIIFTHSDYDHIIGYGAFPDAFVIASQLFCARPDKEVALDRIRSFDHQYYLSRNYPLIYPEVDFCMENDGATYQAGDVLLHFFLAPGHTSDGLMVVAPDLKLCIAGDYLSDVEFPFIDDFSAYRKTLLKFEELVRRFSITTVIPGHGSVATGSDAIARRLEDSHRYLNLLAEYPDPNHPTFLAHLKEKYQHIPSLLTEHQKNIRRFLEQRAQSQYEMRS